MTAVMNPAALGDAWDVECLVHNLDRRGLTQYHAQNLVRKHNREQHAEGFRVGAMATAIIHKARLREDAERTHQYEDAKRLSWEVEALENAWAILSPGLSVEDAAASSVVAHVSPF